MFTKDAAPPVQLNFNVKLFRLDDPSELSQIALPQITAL